MIFTLANILSNDRILPILFILMALILITIAIIFMRLIYHKDNHRVLPNIGETILCVEEEGSQAMNVFKWIGIVEKREGNNVYVEVIKFNKSYGDYRDFENKVIEKLYCPEGSANMRMDNIGGIWIYTL